MCLPGVCDLSLQCHRLVCGLCLWHFLVILTWFFLLVFIHKHVKKISQNEVLSILVKLTCNVKNI